MYTSELRPYMRGYFTRYADVYVYTLLHAYTDINKRRYTAICYPLHVKYLILNWCLRFVVCVRATHTLPRKGIIAHPVYPGRHVVYLSPGSTIHTRREFTIKNITV